MKKILVILFLITACTKTSISDDKIYLFYSQNCGHCHVAMSYIEKTYPKLEIEMVDVANSKGRSMLFECAKKHNLGNRIGTPLFCMGDDYIMGWSSSSIKKFDNLVKPFMKQQ